MAYPDPERSRGGLLLLVLLAGLEPATASLEGKRSSRLSYRSEWRRVGDLNSQTRGTPGQSAFEAGALPFRSTRHDQGTCRALLRLILAIPGTPTGLHRLRPGFWACWESRLHGVYVRVVGTEGFEPSMDGSEPSGFPLAYIPVDW